MLQEMVSDWLSVVTILLVYCLLTDLNSYRQVSRTDGQTERQTDEMLRNSVPFRVGWRGWGGAVTLRAESG